MNPVTQCHATPVAPTDIDRSCRWPLLFLVAKSGAWLALGMIALVIAFAKLVSPELLNGCAWLTYGRLQPAALNMLVYGFATQAAFAIGLWLLARLGRTTLANPYLVFIGASLWNVGVTVGVIGLLAGDSTGYPFLEMPVYAAGILLVALLFVAVAVFQTFQRRREMELYPSVWFVLAGFLWFFWIFSTGMGLLLCAPQRGAMQTVVSTWYASNLFHLWLTPLGLAAAFYFIPKLTGKPLYSAPLAKTVFWTMATFGAVCGFHDGLPLPRWMGALSGACEVLLVVAALALALNLYQTLRGDYRGLWQRTELVLLGLGVLSWIFYILLQAMLSRPAVNGTLQYTWVIHAKNIVLILGFAGGSLLGALQCITPQLSGRAWPCGILQRVTAYGFLLGTFLCVGPLLWAGSLQGAAMNTPTTEFIVSVLAAQGWLKLVLAGLALIAIGALAFAANLKMMAWQWLRENVCACRSVPAATVPEVAS